MESKWSRDSVKSDVFDPINFTISDIEDDEESDVLDTTVPMLDKTITGSQVEFNNKKQNRKQLSNPKSILNSICQELIYNRGQNVTVFTLLCALSGCFAHSVGTYISTQMSSLQMQFGFSSTQTGFITSCNDIGFFLVILFTSQFAHKFHIPQILTKVTVVFGISICGIGMAYFFRPIGRIGNSTLQVATSNMDILCVQEKDAINRIEASEMECELYFQEKGKRSHIVWLIFVFCMIIQGMCKAPRSSFVPVFIDNNIAKKTRSGIYFVLLFCISLIGPALFFSFGAFINQIPVDFKGHGIMSGDPGWIGAWWLGFIIIGTMSVLITLPLVCFPRNIPKEPLKLGHHSGFDAGVEYFISQSLKSIDKKSKPFKKNVKDFFSSIIRVLRKPVYTTILISDCILLFSLAGLWTFLPKYIEDQFRIPSWKTNLILALITVLSSAIGLTLGGILSYQLKLQRRKLIKVKLCCLLICVVLEIIRLFLHCEQPTIRNNPYDSRSINSTVIRSLMDCGCDPNKFFPVCGIDNENYFSPCHAGCVNWNIRSFSRCSGIPGGGESRFGLCQNRCDQFTFFLSITFMLNLVKSIDIVPSYIVIMRSQQEKDKQFGISIFSAALSLLAFLPGPITFGYVVDSACSLWDWTCGVRGHCKIYQLKILHQLLFGSLLISRIGALFFCCISFICTIATEKKPNKVHVNLQPEEKCTEL